MIEFIGKPGSASCSIQFSPRSAYKCDPRYQRFEKDLVYGHYCPTCGCGTFSLSPDWSTGQADFSKLKVGVNAHLFDDFDLAAIPVVVVDGKNQW